MKSIKKIVIALTLVLSATGAFAGCLSAFNRDVMACEDQYTFERLGCKADAVVEYYGCIGRAALS